MSALFLLSYMVDYEKNIKSHWESLNLEKLETALLKENWWKTLQTDFVLQNIYPYQLNVKILLLQIERFLENDCDERNINFKIL